MKATDLSGKRAAPLVFVSHSAEDRIFARKLRNLLWDRGTARAVLSDEITAADSWEARFREELNAAAVVIAVLSPRRSDTVLQEIGAAWAMDKPMIAVVTRRDALNMWPLSLERYPWIELTDIDDEKQVDCFVRKVEDSLGVAVR